MYLDEGSSLVALANNLFEQVPIGIDFHRAEYNTVTNNMASYQERNASRNNDFVLKDDFDVAAIKANAGIDRMYAPVVLTAPLQP
ncbi:MAG: hypothetical protein ABIU05_04410 [Nitrospirales bacterium]